MSIDQFKSVVGWIDTDISAFMETLPNIPCIKYALITQLDSNKANTSHIYSALNKKPALYYIIKIADLQEFLKTNKLFFGFDEIWFFLYTCNPKTVTLPPATIMPPNRTNEIVNEKLNEWMNIHGCILGLADGCGMNFIVKPNVIDVVSNLLACSNSQYDHYSSTVTHECESDSVIDTEQDLIKALDSVTFKNTVVDFNWKFKYRTFTDSTINKIGWFVWVEFERPDTDTGKIGIGRGRDEVIWEGTSLSGAVKTCWVLVKMIVEHELMEGFRWEDHRIFNPHNTIQQLSSIQ